MIFILNVIDNPMEDINIIKGFGILYRTYLSYISKSLTVINLSFSDSVFLVNIGDKEGISQEEIASFLAIDKAAIARSVKSMEKTGYVRTKRSNTDKRAKELYLTDRGQELYQYMCGLHEEWLRQVLVDFEPDKIKIFTQMIGQISERAKSYPK